MNETAPVIELNGVSKRFGRFAAVHDASLDVNEGEVVGFVGANGAGKTTTISLLLGFLAPTKGTVSLFGTKITPASAYRSHARLGYAAGDMELPGQLTGRQYLTFLRHQGRKATPQQYDELIAKFSPQLNKKIHTLSRGNKQKVALVAAFLGDPELIILDEPTSGLDPVMQDVFLDHIRQCQRNKQTVFMSSHYLQEVMDVCSRVILMRQGKLVQDIATAKLEEMGGKRIMITSGYRPTKPPKNAEDVETSFEEGILSLSFTYRGEMGALQSWLAGIKQLRDVEVGEHSLETAFKSLYEPEEGV